MEAQGVLSGGDVGDGKTTPADGGGGMTTGEGGVDDQPANDEDAAAAAVMAAERSAARIERMGYDVGYRLCERLAQHRPLLGPGSPSPESGGGASADASDAAAAASGASSGAIGSNPIVMGGGGHHTVMDPKSEFLVCTVVYLFRKGAERHSLPYLCILLKYE